MMQHFTFNPDPSLIQLSEWDAGKAMGYSEDNFPHYIREQTRDYINLCRELCSPAADLVILSGPECNTENRSLKIEGETFELGKVVFNFLKKADELAVFLCTLGPAISETAKKELYEGDPVKGYILDTIGSIAVDVIMDKVQDELKEMKAKEGKKITNRYSPGYCGWHVQGQQKLFTFLQNNHSGVELTESSLMMPAKSISGLIGIGENVRFNQYSCNICNQKDCIYANLKKQQ